MTTHVAESFNAWLKNERHHSFCSFLVEHMTKLGAMFVKHKAEINDWKGTIWPKIEEKVKINIVKGEVYIDSPFMETLFGIFVGKAVINVDIEARKCTCRGWEMFSIPCNMHVQLQCI